MLDWWDIILRLGVATLASGVIGLNRDLHGKPIGLRTLGLVGLATATVVLLASPAALEAGRLSDGTSRVIQGLLTGIGFLGAGVIVHADQSKVRASPALPASGSRLVSELYAVSDCGGWSLSPF
ncbi:hypothetical protein HMPREF9696_00430 [Afipia clevelandensis ATCC 49720]|uniref:Protein MgtC n=1 Tax=Afipia clevelandensis ATCC 49720 TaxID=883079 RepID=K8PJT2_9BRAD|nr:hypothetical protein HMPREF9696_00430 [Afipia clevelandensis ATCC 49720]